MSLPELFRPFAEHQILTYGATLIPVITSWPAGVVDTANQIIRCQYQWANLAAREANAEVYNI